MVAARGKLQQYFPYVVLWKTHYLRDGNTSSITDGHMNHKDLFYVFMSDAAGTTDTSGKRVVFGANCKVLDVGEDRYTALGPAMLTRYTTAIAWRFTSKWR